MALDAPQQQNYPFSTAAPATSTFSVETPVPVYTTVDGSQQQAASCSTAIPATSAFSLGAQDIQSSTVVALSNGLTATFVGGSYVDPQQYSMPIGLDQQVQYSIPQQGQIIPQQQNVMPQGQGQFLPFQGQDLLQQASIDAGIISIPQVNQIADHMMSFL